MLIVDYLQRHPDRSQTVLNIRTTGPNRQTSQSLSFLQVERFQPCTVNIHSHKKQMIMTSGRETGAWADADGRQGAGGAEDKWVEHQHWFWYRKDDMICDQFWYFQRRNKDTIESISPEKNEQKSGKGGRAHSVWVLELLPCDIYLMLKHSLSTPPG